MSRQAGNTLGEAMRGTVGKMKMKTTKTLARSDYEGAVLLRLFIPGTDLCQLADTAVAAVALCYGFLAPTPTQVQRDTWQRGEQMGPGEVHFIHGIAHGAPGRGPWKSRWYIWKVHVDGMGRRWEGDGGRSRPIPPGRCPYLNCRRDTGLSHSPPNRVHQAPQMDVGKRVPGPAKCWAGWSQEVPKCAGKEGLLLVSASGNGMGVLSPVCGPWARLRTSLSSCCPPRARGICVDRCGWEAALLRARYTSCSGHLDHDLSPWPHRHEKTLQAPHRPSLGRGACFEGTDGTVGRWN